MAFNIGELQGTITLESNVDDAAEQVIGGIRTMGTQGAAAAARAGQAIGDALEVDTSGIEKALDKIKNTLDQQTGAVTKNTKAWAVNEIGADKLRDLERLGVSTKDYIDAIAGVPEAQARMQTALAGSSDELQRLNTLTAQVVAAQRNAETEARALGGAMDDVAESNNEAANSSEGFGSSLEGFSGKLDDVIGKIRDLATGGKAAALAAGAVIGAGLALAIAAAFEQDNVTRQIASQLGSTVDEAGKFGKAAGKLFASNYGDSMEETGQAITSVVKNMQGFGDVSEDVLVGITAQVINTAKAFDQDFNAVTRSAGQLMKTGLARNAQDAMDIITAGFQSGVNAADDLLDTIDEYSTIFRSLGLDGKDALGVLSQGLKAGARDADTVADSMKELLLRIQAGDSKAAIQSLGLNFQAAGQNIAKGGEAAKATTDLIIDQLNKVKDPAERSALAVGLFGTKAEDMQAAIAGIDVDSAASEFEAAYGKIAGSAKQLDETLGGSLQAGFDSVSRAAQGLVSSLGDDVAPLINGAATAFAFLFDILKGALDFIFDLPPGLVAIGAAVAIWASWGTIAAGVEALKIAMLGLAASTRAFLVSMGPLGLILTAAGVAFAFLTDASNKNAEGAGRQQTHYDNLKQTLDSTTGAITAATVAQIKKNAIDSGAADTLKAAGISLSLYAAAASGNVGAQEKFAAAVRSAQDAVAGTTGPLASMATELRQAGISQDDLNAAIASGNWDDVQGKADTYGRKLRDLGVDSDTARGSSGGLQSVLGQVASQSAALTDVMLLTGDAAGQLAEGQADAAAMTDVAGAAAAGAYDRISALATVGGATADEIARMGKEAGLTAPQIAAIQQSAEGATQAADPLAEALAAGSSAASDMDTAIQLLQLALDTLAGNEVDAAQATRAHEAVLRSVGQSIRDVAQANTDATEAQKNADNVAAHLGQTLDGQAVSATNLAVTQEDVDAATRAAADAADKARDAADQQADSLDQLADSSQGMTQRAFEGAGGMANYDAAVQAATQTMVGQRAQFIQSAIAAGVGKDAAEQLADAQGLIPGNVKTAYDAIRANEAKQAADGVAQGVNSIPNQKSTYIQVVTQNEAAIADIRRQINDIPSLSVKRVQIEQNTIVYTSASGQKFSYKGGLVSATMMGFAEGGLIPGMPPSNPTVDNVLATVNGKPLAVRSREFIQPEESVDYYGVPFMEAIQKRKFPKPQGFATGGSPAGAGAGTGPAGVNVQVFIGNQEITDIVQVVVADGLNQTARELTR